MHTVLVCTSGFFHEDSKCWQSLIKAFSSTKCKRADLHKLDRGRLYLTPDDMDKWVVVHS
jgi:hypothetical protein